MGIDEYKEKATVLVCLADIGWFLTDKRGAENLKRLWVHVQSTGVRRSAEVDMGH